MLPTKPQTQTKAHNRCRVLCLFLIGVFLLIGMAPCAVALPECQLTVKLEDKDKQSISDITVTICKVADKQDDGYHPADGFAESGISVSVLSADPSPEQAASIWRYVREHQLPGRSVDTVVGQATFSSLEKGIWLVYCPENQRYGFDPFLVLLPQTMNGMIQYEVTSIPKTQANTPDNTSVYVVKRWEDNDNAAGKRPADITVHLKRDGERVDTVHLNEENGWAHTFTALPDDGTYTVEETAVVGYSVAYNGDAENGFVITNTYGDKLPQTGQLWWPILILTVAGVAFVVLGLIEWRGNRNEPHTP